MGHPIPSYKTDQIAEGHEERLQRLEDGQTRIEVMTAKTDAKIDHLVEKIDQGFKSVNARLDRAEERDEHHEALIDAQKESIKKLSDTEEKRAARWASVKKLVVPVITMALGGVAVKFGEGFWIWLMAILQSAQ